MSDDVAEWLEQVKAEQDAKPTTRAEIITALMSANAAAIRLRGTVYHARAHGYINELLDQMVGR